MVQHVTSMAGIAGPVNSSLSSKTKQLYLRYLRESQLGDAESESFLPLKPKTAAT